MAPVRQFANHPDPMDLWLESQGYYRKMTAKDGSSLFRSIAEQVFYTQRYHPEVRKQCINYLTENPKIFDEFDLEESIGEYLKNLQDPTQWGGPIEIAVFSILYKVNILIFKEVGVQPRIEKQNYETTIMLCSSQDHHYDSVYHKEYTKTAGFCQSLVYEVLYKNVFQMKDVSYAVEKMLHYKPIRHRNEIGICSPRKFLNFNCSSVQYQRKGIEDMLDSEVNVRELLNKGITPFPYKVAKSLDPNIFRNVEFDVWVDYRRGLRFGYFESSSEFRIGVKCSVKLNDGNEYVGHIQEMAADKGPVVLFVEELGEKRTVPYECLEVLHQESPSPPPWPLSRLPPPSTSKQTNEQGSKVRKSRESGDSKSGGGCSSKNAHTGVVGARSRNRKTSQSNAGCDANDVTLTPQQGANLIAYSADAYVPYSGYQVEADLSCGGGGIPLESVQYPILAPTPVSPLPRHSPLLMPLSPNPDNIACRYAPFTFTTDLKDNSRLGATSPSGSICATDYFHFVACDFVDSTSTSSLGDFPEQEAAAAAQAVKDCNSNYMANDPWKAPSQINLNAPKSVLDNGADLPMSDIQTLRFFYNLGNDVYRAQCYSWNGAGLCSSGCATTSCGSSCDVATGSSGYANNAMSDSALNSQDPGTMGSGLGPRRKRRETSVSSPGGVSMSSESETGDFVPRIANAAPSSPNSNQTSSHLPPRFKKDAKTGGKSKSKDGKTDDYTAVSAPAPAPASAPASAPAAPSSLCSKRIGDASARLEPLVLNDVSDKEPAEGLMTIPYGYVCYPNVPLSDPFFQSCRMQPQYPDFGSDGRQQCYSPVSDVTSPYSFYPQSSHLIFPASPGIYVGTPTWAAMAPPTPQ